MKSEKVVMFKAIVREGSALEEKVHNAMFLLSGRMMREKVPKSQLSLPSKNIYILAETEFEKMTYESVTGTAFMMIIVTENGETDCIAIFPEITNEKGELIGIKSEIVLMEEIMRQVMRPHCLN